MPGAGLVRAQDGFVMEEIIVYARKREEVMQRTPVSVTAFTQEELELRQITATHQLGDVTPNLTFDAIAPTAGSNASAAVYIRGIGQIDFTGVTDPGVGLYVDGVYYARSVGSAMDFLDLELIEVLRGPQGTLFGRNTIGGAVLLHTRRPHTEQFEGNLRMEIGSDNKVFVSGHVNLPVSETLALKASGSVRKRDGYVTRINVGTDVGDDNTWGIRLSALWSPSDRFEAYITGDYTREDENGSPGVSLGINDLQFVPGLINRSSLAPLCPFSGVPGPATGLDTMGAPGCANETAFIGEFTSGGTVPIRSELDFGGVTGTLTWEPSNWLTIKSITSYRRMDSEFARDTDNSPFPVFQTEDGFDNVQISQEFQLSGLAFNDRLNWLVGSYFFTEETDNANPVLPVFGGIWSGGVSDNDSRAIFGQLTYDITDQLSITAGLRYTEDTKRFTPDQYYFSPPHPLIQSAFRLPPNVVITSDGLFPVGFRLFPLEENRLDFDDTSPMANITYHWNEDLMTYFTWSEGYKSGGFDQRFATPRFDPVTGINEVTRFGPETVSSFEIGIKSQWFGDKLRFNAAGFYTDYQGLQLGVPGGSNVNTLNGGSADLSGFEIETMLVPTPNWRFTAAVGYIDARYDELDDSVINAPNPITKDNDLVNTPKWTANIGAAYSLPLPGLGTLTPRIDWSYRDDSYNNAINSERLFQEAYSLLNISIMFESNDKRWQAVLGGTNITDEVYLISGSSSFESSFGSTEGFHGRTAQWFLSVNYRF